MKSVLVKKADEKIKKELEGEIDDKVSSVKLEGKKMDLKDEKKRSDESDKKKVSIMDIRDPLISEKRWKYFRYSVGFGHKILPPTNFLTSFENEFFVKFSEFKDEFLERSYEKKLKRERVLKLLKEVENAISTPLSETEKDELKIVENDCVFASRPNLLILSGNIQYFLDYDDREEYYYHKILSRKAKVDFLCDEKDDRIRVNFFALQEPVVVNLSEEEGKIKVDLSEHIDQNTVIYPYSREAKFNDLLERTLIVVDDIPAKKEKRKRKKKKSTVRELSSFLNGYYSIIKKNFELRREIVSKIEVEFNKKVLEEKKSEKLEEEEEIDGEGEDNSGKSEKSESEKKEEKKTDVKLKMEKILKMIELTPECLWLDKITPVPELQLQCLFYKAMILAKYLRLNKARKLFRMVRAHYSRNSYMSHLCNMNISITYVFQGQYDRAFVIILAMFEYQRDNDGSRNSEKKNITYCYYNKMLSDVYYKLSMFTGFYLCDYNRAIELLTISQEKVEKTNRNLFLRSEFFYLLKKYDESIEDLKTVMPYLYHKKEIDDLVYNIAISYFFYYKNELALEYFEKVKNPTNIKKMYLYKGLACFDLCRFEDARECFERGVVTLEAVLRKFEKRKMYLERKNRSLSISQELSFKNWKADYGLLVGYLCEVLIKLGKKKEALYFLDSKNVSRRSNGHINSLLQLGKTEEARVIAEDAVKKYPERFGLLEQLALCYLRLSEFEKSEECYTKLIKNKYRLAHNYYNRGTCKLRMTKYSEAIRDFDLAIDKYELKVWVNRGLSYALLGKFKNAISDYDKEIEHNNKSFAAHFEKSNIYNIFKKWKKCLRYMDRIVFKILGNNKTSKDYFQILHGKALILKAMGTVKNKNSLEKVHIKNVICGVVVKKSKVKEKDVEFSNLLGKEDPMTNENLGEDEKDEDLKKWFDIYKELEIGDPKAYELANEIFTFLIKSKYRTEACLVNRSHCSYQLKKLDDCLRDAELGIKLYRTSGAYYNKGICLKNNKDFEGAKECFKAVISKNPKDFEALFELSECEFQLRNIKESKICLEKVCEINPRYAPAQHNFAYLLYMQKNYDGAITHFEKAVHLNYYFKYLYYHYGLALYGKKSFEEAAEKFRKHLTPTYGIPDDIEGIFQLGCCLLNTGKFEESVSLFDKVLKVRPDSYLSFVNRGMCYSNLSKDELALADFSIALTLKKDDMFIFKKRGHLYLKMLKYREAYLDYCSYCQFFYERDKARRILDIISENQEKSEKEEKRYELENVGGKEIERKNDEESEKKEEDAFTDTDVLFRMGICECELGMIKKALITFDRVLELNPSDFLCHYEKGLIYYGCSETNKALLCYSKVLEKLPRHLDSLNNRGLCYLRLKDLPSALKDFSACVKYSNNKYYKGLFNAAITLRDLGRTKEAMNSLEEAIKVFPGYFSAHWEKGNLNLDILRYKEALADFTKCLELAGTSMTLLQRVYYSRGLCYVKLLNFVEALGDYEILLQIAPNHTGAVFERGYCNLMLKYYDKSAVDFTIYLKFIPGDSRAMMNRCICYYKSKEYDKAMKDLNEILKKNPDHHDAIFYKACCYLELFLDKKAIEWYTKAIKINRHYDLSFFNRGICYESLGLLELAISDFQKAYDLNRINKVALTRKLNLEKKLDEQKKKSESPISPSRSNFVNSEQSEEEDGVSADAAASMMDEQTFENNEEEDNDAAALSADVEADVAASMFSAAADDSCNPDDAASGFQ